MRLTTKSRYGARAIFDLYYNYAGMPVQVKDISKRQEIPLRYLEQIFRHLKASHIVKSVRGPTGGYVLARDANEVSLGDIIHAMREPINPVFCVDNRTGSDKRCARADQCVTRTVWQEAGERIESFFNSITIEYLCVKAKNMGIKKNVKHPFDYII